MIHIPATQISSSVNDLLLCELTLTCSVPVMAQKTISANCRESNGRYVMPPTTSSPRLTIAIL